MQKVRLGYLCKSWSYLETGREFHHLVGLDVLEPVDTSDTVTNAEHTSSFVQVGLWCGTQNAFLEDRADFRSMIGSGEVEVANTDRSCWGGSSSQLEKGVCVRNL